MKKIIILGLLYLCCLPIIGQDKPLGLLVGDIAPDFTAKYHNGKNVQLKKLLQSSPVVLVFYRGEWCPYCNRNLQALQDSLSLITAKGATVIAISPEKSENVDKTILKTKASFNVISDTDLKIMNAYKVAFNWDVETTEKYSTYGIKLTEKNASKQNTLPVPAVYIIGKDGKIKYRHFDENYEKRATVKEILLQL